MVLDLRLQATHPIPLDVTLSAGPGELLALVGPSGAGKSTVLRAIAGLYRPSRARITMDGTPWLDTKTGTNLPPHRRPVGLVFQSYALFPHLTAAGNVAAALTHLPRAARPAAAARLLALVNLAPLADRRPAALSGGQQQRVAVARALAREPRILLLDEPFAALDRPTRETLYREIAALRRHLAIPVILVTHDIEEAHLLADRVAVIDQGRIAAQGTTAQVMFDPTALRILGLREAGSHLRATVSSQDPDGLTRLATAAGPLFLPRIDAAPGTQLRVRIMAHEVILSRAAPAGLSALNILPCTVAAIKSDADPGISGPGTDRATPGGVLVQLAIGDDLILARITRRSCDALDLAPGTPVHAILKSMAVARDDIRPGANAGPRPPATPGPSHPDPSHPGP